MYANHILQKGALNTIKDVALKIFPGGQNPKHPLSSHFFCLSIHTFLLQCRISSSHLHPLLFITFLMHLSCTPVYWARGCKYRGIWGYGTANRLQGKSASFQGYDNIKKSHRIFIPVRGANPIFFRGGVRSRDRVRGRDRLL